MIRALLLLLQIITAMAGKMKVYVSERDSPTGEALRPGDDVPKGIDEFARPQVGKDDPLPSAFTSHDQLTGDPPAGVGNPPEPGKGQTREPKRFNTSVGFLSAQTQAEADRMAAALSAGKPLSPADTAATQTSGTGA